MREAFNCLGYHTATNGKRSRLDLGNSNSEEIFSVSQIYGAENIHRLVEISGDVATSESGWFHALDYIENRSFYLFRPEVLRKFNNRFGGKIGVTQMEFWKMFQIDKPSDIKLCQIIMRGYGVNK